MMEVNQLNMAHIIWVESFLKLFKLDDLIRKKLLVNAFYLFAWIAHWILQVFDSIVNDCKFHHDCCLL